MSGCAHGSEQENSGTTCVAAVVTPTHVICAYVGDSSCVVGSPATGEVTLLSHEHRPEAPDERKRIRNSGSCWEGDGYVWTSGFRVGLGMSRALGNSVFKQNKRLSADKQAVTCVPDVRVHQRSGRGDEVLLLASDGVFENNIDEKKVHFAHAH